MHRNIPVSTASSVLGSIRMFRNMLRTAIILFGGFHWSLRSMPKHIAPLSSFDTFGWYIFVWNVMTGGLKGYSVGSVRWILKWPPWQRNISRYHRDADCLTPYSIHACILAAHCVWHTEYGVDGGPSITISHLYIELSSISLIFIPSGGSCMHSASSWFNITVSKVYNDLDHG